MRFLFAPDTSTSTNVMASSMPNVQGKPLSFRVHALSQAHSFALTFVEVSECLHLTQVPHGTPNNDDSILPIAEGYNGGF